MRNFKHSTSYRRGRRDAAKAKRSMRRAVCPYTSGELADEWRAGVVSAVGEPCVAAWEREAQSDHEMVCKLRGTGSEAWS